MLRPTRDLASLSMIFALAACANSGSDGGTAGANGLASVTQEAPGKDCPAGGTRIATGIDSNGNGTLDPDEVTSSQVVCSGAAGKEGAAGADGQDGQNGANGGSPSLLRLDPESAGANCASGGTRIQSGLDTNANGTLDASEVTATRYVCNGANGAGNTSTDAVSTYLEGGVNVPTGGASTTVTSATIAAPGAGKVIAISSADTFCASPAIGNGHDCNANGATTGYYTLATTASADAASGAYDFFYVSPNSTENSSRTAVFNVAAAGNVTVYLRAKTSSAGAYGFWRTSLTLVFVP